MMYTATKSLINTQDTSRKPVILPDHGFAVNELMYKDEERNEAEAQMSELSTNGGMSRDSVERIRDDLDDGISFDTDQDDNISLNSIHSLPRKFNFSSINDEKNTETPSLSAKIATKRHPAINITIMSDAIKNTRDEFLHRMTGADHDTFRRAITDLPEKILFLAASAFLEDYDRDSAIAATPSARNTRIMRDAIS